MYSFLLYSVVISVAYYVMWWKKLKKRKPNNFKGWDFFWLRNKLNTFMPLLTDNEGIKVENNNWLVTGII